MKERAHLLLKAMTISSLIAVFDIIIELTLSVLTLTAFSFFDVATILIPEFGVLLIVGSCLMARDPLEDERRYHEDGSPVRAWKYTLIGREVLLVAALLFILMVLFTLLGYVI